MEDNELKAIQEAITRQATNNYPQIYIKDLQSGRVFEYGKNCHDRLVISEDGRSLHYENLQNGDGSCCGDYRFYYEKPKIETEMDKMHEWDLDHYARNIENKSLNKLAEFEDFMEEQGLDSLKDLQTYINKINKYELGIRKQFIREINEEEFFDMKDKNQALKDRWQKLKEFVVDRLKYDREFIELTENDMYYDFSIADQIFLNKMQELEKE